MTRRPRPLPPVRLVAAERALLDDAERQLAAAHAQLARAEREHTLVCAALVASRGHQLGADATIVERTPHGTLVLEPIVLEPIVREPSVPPASVPSPVPPSSECHP